MSFTAEDINCAPGLNFFYPIGPNGNAFIQNKGSFPEVCSIYKAMAPMRNFITEECQANIDKFATDAGYVSRFPFLFPVFCQRK